VDISQSPLTLFDQSILQGFLQGEKYLRKLEKRQCTLSPFHRVGLKNGQGKVIDGGRVWYTEILRRRLIWNVAKGKCPYRYG